MDGRSGAMHVTAVVVVAAFLYFARSVFVPLTCALLMVALMWPIQRALQRRLPKLLALLIALSIAIAVIVAMGLAVVWAFSRISLWLFANADRIQAIYSSWTVWLEGHGVAIAAPLAEVVNMSWVLGALQRVAAQINSAAGFAVLLLIFVMLGLLEVDEFTRRLRDPSTQLYGANILRANSVIATKLRRFMLIRTFASILIGFVVFAFAFAAGLEIAVAWGLIAFALNYIPFIGPLIATVFPTLFAVAQFGSWQGAVLIFVSLNVIQFVIGSYLEPRLAGASLQISPFAVIFFLFFWAFLWGVPGAFIGVPILIAIVTYCALDARSRWLAAMLSGQDFVSAAESEESATR